MIKKLALIIILMLSVTFPLNQISNSPENIVQRDNIASASLSDQLLELEKKLAAIRKQKQDINSVLNSENLKQSQYGVEIARLTNEINLKNATIQEFELDIERLNLEVEILEYNIGEATKSINEKEQTIEELNNETSVRLTDMYLDQKSYSDLTMIFDPVSSYDFVKKDLYRKSIQEETEGSLVELKNQREQLEKEKEKLDKDKVQMEKDKTLVDEQKISLEKEKTLLDQKRGYLNVKIRESLNLEQQQRLALEQSSDKEKKILAEAELIKQKIFDEIGSIPNGSYVYKGTIIGVEGMSGWATGPHLHFGVAFNGVEQNPCNFVNCASRSAGSNIAWPISPAGIITSGYGGRANDFHAAIDISTGGSGAIIAAHDGWLVRGRQYCYDLTWVKCNGGYANYVIICENKTNCNAGYKTLYWHLKN